MTITLDTRAIFIISVLILLMMGVVSGRWGCQTLVGCLVGLVCIVIGVILLGMSGWIGG